ncbi:TPA: hypothetical protein ACSCYS_004510 [Aeromonas veronii]
MIKNKAPQEPDFDAPQSDWDKYDAAMKAIPDAPSSFQFKSVERQKAERAKERLAEFDLLPMAVKRAALRRKQDELDKAAGKYIDGGFADDEQIADAKALRSFESKASRHKRQILAKYVRTKEGSFGCNKGG